MNVDIFNMKNALKNHVTINLPKPNYSDQKQVRKTDNFQEEGSKGSTGEFMYEWRNTIRLLDSLNVTNDKQGHPFKQKTSFTRSDLNQICQSFDSKLKKFEKSPPGKLSSQVNFFTFNALKIKKDLSERIKVLDSRISE